MPEPILADAIGGVITIIVVIITVIGWITNLVNSQNRPPRRPQGQQRPVRDRKIQNEIDSFLKEVGSKRRGGEPVLSADDIEVVEPPPARKPPGRPAPGASSGRRSPSRRGPGKGSKPAERAPQRKSIAREELGSEIRTHVQEHMGARLSDQVAKDHLPHLVDQSVASHLGAFTAADPQSFGRRGMLETTGNPRPAIGVMGLVADLRKPDTIRKAILINEILSPPVSQRSPG